MTEMEQLKRNTEVEYAKQRMAELTMYIVSLTERSMDALYWALRGDKLFFLTIIGYFANIGLCVWLDASEDIRSVSGDLITIVMWLTIFRSWYLYREFSVLDAELEGVMKTLEVLGMAKRDEDGDRTRKKVEHEPMFARIKGLWEKVWERERNEAMQPV